MRHISGVLAVLLLGVSASAFAADEDDAAVVERREEIRCFPAKGIINFVKGFEGLDASRTDTIEAVFEANIEIHDGGALPERVFMRTGDEEVNLDLDDKGTMNDFAAISVTMSEETELCSQDKARAGQAIDPDKPASSFNVPMDIRFKNRSGVYDIAEVIDGLKDGKTFYKKMISGPASLLVPKMTHLMIDYKADDTPLELTAFNGDEPLATPNIEEFAGAYVLRLKDLKKAGATRLEVKGGVHSLSPTPSVKIMKKFGFGGDE